MKAANAASRLPRLWPAPGNRRPFGPRRMLSLLLLLAAAISAGCVWSVPEPVLVREPRPEPVPLRIGVYYSPEFRSFTYQHHPAATTWILGEPSVRLLHEALTLLFIEVVEVPRPGSGPSLRGDLAGIIKPRIASAAAVYGHDYVMVMAEIDVSAHVTYGFTVYSPSGEHVASWDVTGQGKVSSGNLIDAASPLKQSFEHAMREAAWKLTSGFRDISEVREWLTEQAVR
jgi:hypothetical protein